jgi:hypothetical protein
LDPEGCRECPDCAGTLDWAGITDEARSRKLVATSTEPPLLSLEDRCQWCSYNLHGLHPDEVAACPECGRAINWYWCRTPAAPRQLGPWSLFGVLTLPVLILVVALTFGVIWAAMVVPLAFLGILVFEIIQRRGRRG